MPYSQITIRDHSSESNLFARRTFFAFLFVIILMLVLLSNMYHLQVERHDTYRTRSNDNRISVRPIAPNRGLIYDRNGVLLAENRPTYSLEVIPEKSGKLAPALKKLGDIIGLDEEEQAKLVKSAKRSRRFKSFTIKGNLSEEQVARFSVHQHKFPGFSIEARLTRFYPYGEALTHALGYVGKINKKELQQIDLDGDSANYAASRDIGKQGIEKYYEKQLHGQVGYREVEINSSGRILRTLKIEPPTPGNDLTLSLDIDLQKVAQEALQGQRGAIVAMDPRSGGLLVFYSNPSYDPNLFVHGISSKDYTPLIQSLDRPLVNRVTQGRYPPASTVKPFMALLGLESGLVTPETEIWDPGYFQIPNVKHKFRDHLKWGHGKVNLLLSVMKSCDIYYYDLAYRLGIDKISEFMAPFGFGELTGVDIKEEVSAILPSRPWKRAQYNQPWYAGDTVNIGIGQGYWTVTPLQLATAVTTLVNKGIKKRPHFVAQQRQVEGDGHTIVATEDPDLPPVIINSAENWDVVLDTMHQTVSNIAGSAHRTFKGATYESAGKTGTAQVVGIAQDEEYDEDNVAERNRDNAMYIGYAPYDKPEIVVAVAVENAGGGSKAAAPLARLIMDRYFANQTKLTTKLNQSAQGSPE